MGLMYSCSQSPNAYKGKRVVVMGLGRFGGGVGITRWLIESGADVLVTDTANLETLRSSIAELRDLLSTNRLEIQVGPHSNFHLDNADVLVVNPAVPQPWNNQFVREAESRNIDLTTEIEIVYRQLDPSRIVAITGSAGKSTTSAMTHAILQSTGHHAILGGNIGGSLLSEIQCITPNSYVVLELSSAMIYWLWGRKENAHPVIAPAVACLTNYSPNHIDWHGQEEHYKGSKQCLLNILPEHSTAVLNQSLEEWGKHLRSKVHVIHDEHAIRDCVLPGQHNAINAGMAVVAVSAITKSSEELTTEYVQSVRRFTGLPHRLNLCHETDSLKFYNDSKSTIPQATVLAIESIAEQLPKRSIHLICGGYDKGSDLSVIAQCAKELGGTYTIGATAQSITDASKDYSITCNTLQQAMEAVIERVTPGDIVLLSPGCASWDQYDNYEQRGEEFEKLARMLTGTDSCISNL